MEDSEKFIRGVLKIQNARKQGAYPVVTTPTSGCSSNVGILTITSTYSRHVFHDVGLLLTSEIIADAGINRGTALHAGMKETNIAAFTSIIL